MTISPVSRFARSGHCCTAPRGSACLKRSTSGRRPASTCGPSIRWRSSAAGRTRSISISRKRAEPMCAPSAFATSCRGRDRTCRHPIRRSARGCCSAASSTSTSAARTRRSCTSSFSRRLCGSGAARRLERAKKTGGRADANRGCRVPSREINRRDQIIAEKNEWWSNEARRRDVIIDELRQEQEWMRSGWRRFIIRRPGKPASTPRE